jgi:hypothetical protein
MRSIARILLHTLGIALCVVLASCGDEAEAPGVVGTYDLDVEGTRAAWTLQAESLDDEDPRRKQLAPQIKALEGGQFRVTTTFGADGTVVSESVISGKRERAVGTWTQAGETLKMDVAIHLESEEGPRGRAHIEAVFRDGVIEILREGRIAWVMTRRPER